MAEALQDIVFKDFQGGIASSPLLGFADMRNIQLGEMPGAASASFLPTKQSGTTITDLPMWIVIDPATQKLYSLDQSGNVYKSTDAGVTWSLITGNTLTGGNGQGLAIWKNYLFVCRGTKIDVMALAAETWTNDWVTTLDSDSAFHPMILTPDDKLTIGAGRYIATITETSGSTFAPGTSSTYTFTARAMTLPANYRIKCLAMLGLDLRIGTWMGSNLYDLKVADVFCWDRSSTSFTGSKTLHIADNGVSQMIERSGLLYIIAGVKGTVYVSNGSQVKQLKELKSIDLLTTPGANVSPNPGAIIFHDGKILLGIAGGSGGTPLGVYALNDSNAVTLENVISSGEVTGLAIGALFSVSPTTYLIGWQGASAQGIDLVGYSGYRATSYAAYVDTSLVRVGTPGRKRSFSEVEFQLAKPLTAGTGVRIAYRKNLTDSFTTIGTFDYSTYGALASGRLDASIADAENIQLRASLTCNASGTVSPLLMEVRLR
jgi:hypothetical protein